MKKTVEKEEKLEAELRIKNAAKNAEIEAQDKVLEKAKEQISNSASDLERVFVQKQRDLQLKMEGFFKDLNDQYELTKSKLNEDGDKRASSLAEADEQARGSLEKLRQASQSTTEELVQVRKMILELKEKLLVQDKSSAAIKVHLEMENNAPNTKVVATADMTSVPKVEEINSTPSSP